MLVDSHRLTDADRAAWEVLEWQDRRRRVPGWMVRSATRAIGRFLCDGPAYVSCSWGKDSVVVAHLARSVAPGTPLVHAAFGAHENPDCAAVRDEFCARWPMPAYDVECPWTTTWFRAVETAHGRRRIMGIRSAESSARRISAATHGVATTIVCRPILHWTTDHVFAYLAQHDIPVHPAYAMSRGGTIPRESLRVDVIGGAEGSERGRADWERDYYGDVLAGQD